MQLLKTGRTLLRSVMLCLLSAYSLVLAWLGSVRVRLRSREEKLRALEALRVISAIPDFTATSSFHVELTESERQSVRDLMRSAGWPVLDDLVWGGFHRFCLFQCSVSREDQRFWQGAVFAYNELQKRSVEATAPEKRRAKENQFYKPLHDFHRTARERARGRRASRPVV